MRGTGRVVLLAVCSLVQIGLSATPAAATVTCTFDPNKGAMIVSAPADLDQVVLLRGPAAEILVGGSPCVGNNVTATVNNVGTVRVNGGAGHQDVTLDLAGGLFGGVAFELNLGDGAGEIVGVGAGTSPLQVAVGATLFEINGVQSSLSGVEGFNLIGSSGPDSLSLGGVGLGPAWPGTGILAGGAGHDRLEGGPGSNTFTGGAGVDLVS